MAEFIKPKISNSLTSGSLAIVVDSAWFIADVIAVPSIEAKAPSASAAGHLPDVRHVPVDDIFCTRGFKLGIDRLDVSDETHDGCLDDPIDASLVGSTGDRREGISSVLAAAFDHVERITRDHRAALRQEEGNLRLEAGRKRVY